MTLTVAALVLTIGIPSFRELLLDTRLTTQLNHFNGVLLLARSEALRRGVRVTLCRSADGVRCGSGVGWEQGWLLFTDSAANGQLDGDDVLLQRQTAFASGTTLRGNLRVANYISFTPDGFSRLLSGGFQAGTLTLCDTRGVGSATDRNYPKQLILNSFGRVRVQRGVEAVGASCEVPT